MNFEVIFHVYFLRVYSKVLKNTVFKHQDMNNIWIILLKKKAIELKPVHYEKNLLLHWAYIYYLN